MKKCKVLHQERCWKLLEEVQSVASRDMLKLLEEVQSIASRDVIQVT